MTSKEKEPIGALAAKIAEERMEERAKESSQEDEQILEDAFETSTMSEVYPSLESAKWNTDEALFFMQKARQSERKKLEAQLKEARECIVFKHIKEETACLLKCKNTACPLNEGKR